MVTAHGASERAWSEMRGRGLNVIEATCPLVHAAHRAIAKLVREGFHPVIIGKRNHVEVRGMTGDLDAFDVVAAGGIDPAPSPGFPTTCSTLAGCPPAMRT